MNKKIAILSDYHMPSGDIESDLVNRGAKLHNTCKRCKRKLKNIESKLAGAGKVCLHKLTQRGQKTLFEMRGK